MPRRLCAGLWSGLRFGMEDHEPIERTHGGMVTLFEAFRTVKPRPPRRHVFEGDRRDASPLKREFYNTSILVDSINILLFRSESL
jgi:hypothetical protein